MGETISGSAACPRRSAALTPAQAAGRADVAARPRHMAHVCGWIAVSRHRSGFPAVLTAWHERQITTHLDQLSAAADPADPALVRLKAVLHTYAQIQHHSTHHHGGELAALLHRGEHVDHARQRLHDFLHNLIAEAARDGNVRDDVATDELATYCLHALTAAGTFSSQDAVDRLVAVTLAGLRPAPAPSRASIGVAVNTDRDTDGQMLLRDADLAMYHAKRNGKGRHEVFEPTMRTMPVRSLDLESDLNRALVAGEFALHYRPIVELTSGDPLADRLVGVEALVRWLDPQHGLTSPQKFVPWRRRPG